MDPEGVSDIQTVTFRTQEAFRDYLRNAQSVALRNGDKVQVNEIENLKEGSLYTAVYFNNSESLKIRKEVDDINNTVRSKVYYTLCRLLPKGTSFNCHDFKIRLNDCVVGDVDTLLFNETEKLHFLVERKRKVHSESVADVLAQLERTRHNYNRLESFINQQKIGYRSVSVLYGEAINSEVADAVLQSGAYVLLDSMELKSPDKPPMLP